MRGIPVLRVSSPRTRLPASRDRGGSVMDIPGIPNIGDSIAAIAALGTAAYGLVDAAKAFWGGPSVAGYGRIKAALAPFNPALQTLGNAPWQTLRANWLNGVAKADQKATAKSLIHLTLSPDNASKLARAVDIDADALEAVAKKIDKGTDLAKSDIDVLGRFDALVSAVLDAAYERADQQYRNTAKCCRRWSRSCRLRRYCIVALPESSQLEVSRLCRLERVSGRHRHRRSRDAARADRQGSVELAAGRRQSHQFGEALSHDALLEFSFAGRGGQRDRPRRSVRRWRGQPARLAGAAAGATGGADRRQKRLVRRAWLQRQPR